MQQTLHVNVIVIKCYKFGFWDFVADVEIACILGTLFQSHKNEFLCDHQEFFHRDFWGVVLMNVLSAHRISLSKAFASTICAP